MSRWLEGKTIVVGLSGGIACYKAADVVRQLRSAGARVRVVMTRHALEFITPLTLQTLAGEPVSTDLFDLTQESEIGHIRLADTADAIVDRAGHRQPDRQAGARIWPTTCSPPCCWRRARRCWWRRR